MWQLKFAILLCGIVANAKPKIAFTATLSKNTNVGYHEAVKYNRVLTNIGGAYHPWTGHFKVPYSGIYLISCTAMSETKKPAYLQIVKNHQVLTTIFSSTKTFPQSAQTLILQLRRGDRVWVWGRYERLTLRDNSYFNVFSGALLH
ncbi:complement C1q subcomponent subunit B-like [Saccostrea echinata]|uniref:complement C1q subcomponent subunit B-like n=1 Tax=Saccostrea echinata TaxID=191078 RepID=UPI002A7F5909|nr:complement C1q subcomponent subunit B-like [Saccostrea echinata]